ncbi:amidase [Litchfieldella rifensis]|uniref:Amidase n=1 Tax=Litchfieldella rifensis TaxID=762643 RepID=A0ABV7LPZ3_9GAMM
MGVKRIMAAESAKLTAREAARRIAEGALTSADLVAACLECIAAEEERVQAWEFLDRDKAMAEAEERDRRRQRGWPLGPLHGVPVAIKDIVDVKGMPTGNGTPIDAGKRPFVDAAVIRRLRAAGAVILGKTVTTEFAYYHPGKTRNPHDAGRTPGGSSSGSAAAVAAGMVPLALGSQTNGSVIRPASFCGVVGFKPSFGAVPRTGMLTLAPSLDQVGVFARTIEDVALAELLMGPDGQDVDALESPGPLSGTALAEPPVTPALAFVKTPFWERADAETQAAFSELGEALGEQVDEVELPEIFVRGAGWLEGVMAAEMARNLGHYADRAPHETSEKFRGLVADGRAMKAPDYLAARDMRRVLRDALGPIFDRFDVIVTPAAPGEAPEGLESTGDPTFCSLWTFCGLPAISLPLMTGPNGMPLGVQLVGQYGQDARLLRTARWLVRTLSGEGNE